MDYPVWPRVKEYAPLSGAVILEKLRVFALGEGELFFSVLEEFMPGSVEKADYDGANVRISQSTTYSPYPEFCSLRIRENGVEIHCRDAAGARNAAATLVQRAKKTPEGYALPLGDIRDWPDAQYRAYMVESSGRVWVDMPTILSQIRTMALCRMNVLQFHFMEDPGCTVPLESCPGLHGFGPENKKFTRQEVTDMIAYAGKLGISVTPFIEVLSHAADLALTEGIACPGDKEENLYDVCLGQEKTFRVIEKVIREVAALFPDGTLHIGADEYDMSRVTPKTAHWMECPHCQKVMAEKGYTSLRELFLYGIQRINRIVNRAGKVMMMWNADLHPGHLPKELDRNILLHYYRYCSDLGRENIYHLHLDRYADEGFSAVNSYYPQTYMDLPEYMSAEKLCSWSYRNDPLVSRRNRALIPGGCLCSWEEFEHYKRTVKPAIALFADRLWNAHGDAATREDARGRAVTRVVFEGALPEGMDVFACIGDVLPPLENEKPAHLPMITASLAEIREVREALGELNTPIAEAYTEALDWVLKKKAEETGYTGPRTERIKFQG